MKQVDDNTFRLGSAGHNYYVITDGDEVTVIDAGCRKDWGKLVSGLESVGLSIESIAGIVVTHSHADHFGFAKEATDRGVDVAVHEQEETRALGTYAGRYAVGALELPIFNLKMWKNFLPMVGAGVMKYDFVEQVGTFKDGERLSLPGQPVAVHTPGHTEGHCMFHLPDQGLLFTGDGLITMNLLGSERGPQVIERRFSQNHEQAFKSLDRIVGLDARLLFPGHGDPWEGSPADAVAAARAFSAG